MGTRKIKKQFYRRNVVSLQKERQYDIRIQYKCSKYYPSISGKTYLHFYSFIHQLINLHQHTASFWSSINQNFTVRLISFMFSEMRIFSQLLNKTSNIFLSVLTSVSKKEKTKSCSRENPMKRFTQYSTKKSFLFSGKSFQNFLC